eukprot:6619981-Prymnesium_polylepis.1
MPPPAACGETIAVLTPISWPRESSRGPPELPGLMAASVWMQPLMGRPPTPSTSRARADTPPVAADTTAKSGFEDDSGFDGTSKRAKRIADGQDGLADTQRIGSADGNRGGSMMPGLASILSMARSFSGSMPTTRASYASEEPCVVTLSRSACSAGRLLIYLCAPPPRAAGGAIALAIT